VRDAGSETGAPWKVLKVFMRKWLISRICEGEYYEGQLRWAAWGRLGPLQKIEG